MLIRRVGGAQVTRRLKSEEKINKPAEMIAAIKGKRLNYISPEGNRLLNGVQLVVT